jgi:hypothetical protein
MIEPGYVIVRLRIDQDVLRGPIVHMDRHNVTIIPTLNAIEDGERPGINGVYFHDDCPVWIVTQDETGESSIRVQIAPLEDALTQAGTTGDPLVETEPLAKRSINGDCRQITDFNRFVIFSTLHY